MFFYLLWFFPYLIFIIYFTGPEDLSVYPSQSVSPYKLPWKPGIAHFVAQGNNSFTSHRGGHSYAWDFVMTSGTEILAARSGQVLNIEEHFIGIGMNSNYITIKHEDGEQSTYAHIQQNGALVKLNEFVKQGQTIARSGMVGQTVFPHVHFYVSGVNGSGSIPISFRDVPGGVPIAGKFYTSENMNP